MANPFGWDLPAGAATDPRAPYNRPEPPECVSCGDEADRTGCKEHSGPVCASCSCPQCPGPNLDEEPDGPDPDALNDIERDMRDMRAMRETPKGGAA